MDTQHLGRVRTTPTMASAHLRIRVRNHSPPGVKHQAVDALYRMSTDGMDTSQLADETQTIFSVLPSNEIAVKDSEEP